MIAIKAYRWGRCSRKDTRVKRDHGEWYADRDLIVALVRAWDDDPEYIYHIEFTEVEI
jgi:hypothetical protein